MTDTDKLFSKVARHYAEHGRVFVDDEASRNGAQIFKRKALGFCGSEAVKSADEIENLLIDNGIASSIDEARQLLPNLLDKFIPYGRNRYIQHYLFIKNLHVEEDIPEKGLPREYQISAGTLDRL